MAWYSLNLDGKAEPLVDYLGEFRWFLDIFTRRKLIFYPPHRWVVNFNWKLEAENFGGDPYHHYATHRSIIELGGRPPNPELMKVSVSVASRKGHKAGGSGRGLKGKVIPESHYPAFYPLWALHLIEKA